MDGIHHLGGMHGFGPVEMEVNEPVFHAAWERRACGLTLAAQLAGGIPSGKFRYAIERMDPTWYLESLYYERWFTATATCLVEAGLVAQEELDDRLGAPYPLARPVRAARLEDPGPSSETPRYRVGDAVRVRQWHPVGHTRAPQYVQGKPGVVVRHDGTFSLPDVECHSDSVRLEPTYSVRFETLDLWATPGDAVYVDLWESYLEPLGAAANG